MSLRVSQFLDSQLEGESVEEAAHGIAADAGERDRLTLYTLIGDALRGNPTPDDGFTQRILARMGDTAIEPGYDPLADRPAD